MQQTIDLKKKADINLLKSKVEIILTKKGINNLVARVALVLDISGSMTNQYNSGAVQAFLERIVPVASKLDNDCNLDVWFFGSKFKRTKSVTEETVNRYVEKECGEKVKTFIFLETSSLMKELGLGNNEALVINDVIHKYTQEESSKLPTFVIFLSDGGVTNHEGIKNALVKAAKYPIFWQFVGLGGSNYGILKELDNMPGRVIDNANFFHVDDLQKITDDELYERLIDEFPLWVKEAKNKNILQR
ncbi:MAG: VWA domain-containing protein [Rivularia sp. (in: cyanobacteria)]